MRARDSSSLSRASTLAIAWPTSSANAHRRASAPRGNAARMDAVIAEGHGAEDWTVIAKDAVR